MAAQGGNVGGGAEEPVAAAPDPERAFNGPFPKRPPQRSEADMAIRSSPVLLASAFKLAQLVGWALRPS